jgi:hypothetical protein
MAEYSSTLSEYMNTFESKSSNLLLLYSCQVGQIGDSTFTSVTNNCLFTKAQNYAFYTSENSSTKLRHMSLDNKTYEATKATESSLCTALT